jgi:hypothetical protein
VGVEAAHAPYFMAEALLGENVRDAVFGHPGTVAVPEPMGGQAGNQRQPGGHRNAIRNDPDPGRATACCRSTLTMQSN